MKDVRAIDRFVVWPTVLTCIFLLVLIVLWSGPTLLAFIFAPILLSVWAVVALVAFMMAIVATRGQIWRRALSLSVLPLATVVGIANAGTAWAFAIEAGERLHFQVMRHSYLEEVAKQSVEDNPRFALWMWGGFVVGHGVVYDESDEIAMPEQSPAWKKRVADTEVGACGAWGVPLGEHFYLVRTGC